MPLQVAVGYVLGKAAWVGVGILLGKGVKDRRKIKKGIGNTVKKMEKDIEKSGIICSPYDSHGRLKK